MHNIFIFLNNLCISFSFIAKKRKRNAPKEKETTLIFNALWACRLNGCSGQSPHTIASQTRCYAPQTMLGKKQKFRALRSEQLLLVRQQQDKHCLTEGSLLVFGRTLQIISERSSLGEFLCAAFLCGQRNAAPLSKIINNKYYVIKGAVIKINSPFLVFGYLLASNICFIPSTELRIPVASYGM